MAASFDSILITDFDGTITRNDFYALAVPRFLEPDLPDYWTQYSTGEITHFEAMRAIFGHIRTDDATLRGVVRQMGLDPKFAYSVERLRRAGWDVEVVSAGCRWYIDQILEEAGVALKVHASPGVFHPDRGLRMELDTESPYASPASGIDKVAVVRAAMGSYTRVAFAGNGAPDLGASLAVEPDHRFARGWLSDELTRTGKKHRRFSWWREIAETLTEGA